MSITKKWNPEGSGYDEKNAPPRDPVTGHGYTRNKKTRQILKGRKHDTWRLGVQGETEAGYQIYKAKNGKYYSKPSKNVDNSKFLAEPKVHDMSKDIRNVDLRKGYSTR